MKVNSYKNKKYINTFEATRVSERGLNRGYGAVNRIMIFYLKIRYPGTFWYV